MTSKTSDFARYNRAPDMKAPLISRKDTIIIAMLVNIALLVVLFATASRRYENQGLENVNLQNQSFVIQTEPLQVKQNTSLAVVDSPSQKSLPALPRDEIDDILERFNKKGASKQVANQGVREDTRSKVASQHEYYVVKSGDSPWKIARKFHLDFEELLKLNNLDESSAKNLKIGQKLRIR